MKDKIKIFIYKLLIVNENDSLLVRNTKLFISKNKELVLYIIVGASTTFLNFFIFFITLYCFNNFFNFNIPAWLIAELIAFIIAIIYSFCMDKYVVFNSKFINITKLLFEFLQFVITRVLVESISAFIMHISIDIYGLNVYVVKVLVMILIIVLNYITSKFIIFRK